MAGQPNGTTTETSSVVSARNANAAALDNVDQTPPLNGKTISSQTVTASSESSSPPPPPLPPTASKTNVWAVRKDQHALRTGNSSQAPTHSMPTQPAPRAGSPSRATPHPNSHTTTTSSSSRDHTHTTAAAGHPSSNGNGPNTTMGERKPSPLALADVTLWPEVGKASSGGHSPVAHPSPSDREKEGLLAGAVSANGSGTKKAEKTKWSKIPPAELQAVADSLRAPDRHHHHHHHHHRQNPQQPHNQSRHPTSSSQPHSQPHSNRGSQLPSERSSPRLLNRSRRPLDEHALGQSLSSVHANRRRGSGNGNVSQPKSLRSSAAPSPSGLLLTLSDIPRSLPFAIPATSNSNSIPPRRSTQPKLKALRHRPSLSKLERVSSGEWKAVLLECLNSSSTFGSILPGAKPGTSSGDDWTAPVPITKTSRGRENSGDQEAWFVVDPNASITRAPRRIAFGAFAEMSRGSSRRSSFDGGSNGYARFAGGGGSGSGGYNTPNGMGLGLGGMHLTVPRGGGGGGGGGRGRGGRGGRGGGGYTNRHPRQTNDTHSGSSSPGGNYRPPSMLYIPQHHHQEMPEMAPYMPDPYGYYGPPSGTVNYLPSPFAVNPYAAYPMQLPMPPAAMPFVGHAAQGEQTMGAAGQGAGAGAAPTAPVPVPVTNPGFPLDPLRYYILGQVEYYMSVQNLCKDLFLRRQMDSEGWIDLHIIASFNRMRQLTLDTELIRQTTTLSSIIEMSGEKVRLASHAWRPFVFSDATPTTVGFPHAHNTNSVMANGGEWVEQERGEEESGSTTTNGESRVNGTLSPPTSVEGHVGGKGLEESHGGEVIGEKGLSVY